MYRLETSAARPLARFLAYRGSGDGRLVVLGALAFYLAAVTVASFVWHVDLWPWLGVPPGPAIFFDTTNVLAALECQRLGYDPLVYSPCDPWQRPMFYPRVWLGLQWLGLDQSHTVLVGVLIAALFVAMLYLLLGPISTGEGIVVACAVCSPAVMLALQRGNMDVVLFSVLAVSILLWRRASSSSQILSPAVVLLAAIGKLYPAFGLAAFFLLGSRRAAIAATGCGALFVAYVALTLSDVMTVARTATQGQYYSYGARILLGLVYHQVVGQNWDGLSYVAQLLAAAPVAVLGVAVWIGSRRLFLPRTPLETQRADRLLSFYLGAFIFLGTFAVFKNYDYRLIYLLLTLPQLCAWVIQGPERLKVLASLALLGVVVDLWIGALSEPLQLSDELVTWAVAALLLALTAVSAPRMAVPRVWAIRTHSPKLSNDVV